MGIYRVSVPVSNGKTIKSVFVSETPEHALASVISAASALCEERGWKALTDRASYLELDRRGEVVKLDLEEAFEEAA